MLITLPGGCVPAASGPSAQPVPSPLVAPATVLPDIAPTAAALETAFRAADIGFIPARQPYVSSEPLDVRSVPRVVYQEVLPRDPDAGFVVVYDALNGDAATSAARSLASYLGSGFGETNYATDARFAVQVYGPTVVFGWWSPGASLDPATASRAFGVLQGFGTPVPVVR